MIVQLAIYVVLVVAAAGVVFTPDPRKTVFVFGFYGLVLALVFLVLQAPDVALSEVAVGSVAVPLVTLVALARMRRG